MIILNNQMQKQLQALMPRLADTHPSYNYLDQLLGKLIAGSIGENSLSYYFHLASLEEYEIIFGVRLKEDDYFFQIDCLLLTPYVIHLIEVKHIKGELSLNSMEQLLRASSNQIEVFPNPLIQAKTQAYKLKKTLRQLGCADIPIHPYVVFTHPTAILNFPSTTVDMIPLQRLPNHIKVINNLYKNNEHYEIGKIYNIIIERHCPNKENLMLKYNLEIEHIIRGVRCRNCNNFSMERMHHSWKCSICNTLDRHAHLEALKDYAHIFGPAIRNKDAQYFLKVSSPDICYRLLNHIPCSVQGSNKGRIYYLNSLIN